MSPLATLRNVCPVVCALLAILRVLPTQAFSLRVRQPVTTSRTQGGVASLFLTTTATPRKIPRHAPRTSRSQRTSVTTTTNTRRFMTFENEPSPEDSRKLPFFLDLGTRGGALFGSLVLFVTPCLGYTLAVSQFDVDPMEAGRWFGAGFAGLALLAWVATLLVRVVNKDMTYAKQLKNYEDAVIAKRFAELDEDEVEALAEDLQRDDF